MKQLAIALVALAFVASPALAFQCPLLIKQVKDQIAKMNAEDPKVKQAQTLLDEAQKLHGEASHANSVAKAEEAAKLVGVTLKKN